MTKKLRPYQQEAIDKTIAWIRKNSLPCLLDLSVGAGKTVIISELCKLIIAMSPEKKILVIAPNKELIEQNYEEYVSFGGEASYYSASIGKSLRHSVIFASERTFDKVAEKYGSIFSCVIIDEADCTTPTIKKIIADMRKGNENLRVIGLSGTCFVLGQGYIYEIDENDAKVEEAINPYYKKLLYRVSTTSLMLDGFLTKLETPDTSISYDTSNLRINGGNFTKESLDEAFVGHGKKTADIIADVVNRANAVDAEGVLIFGATIDHCQEIMASLPAYNSALLTGSTPKLERERIIKDYKSKKIRFLVSIIITTRGFNAPHTKAVAVLRATQSARLLIQMAGRAIRLYNGKDKAYFWDYAGNYERFAGKSGNIFEPDIQAFGQKPSLKTEIQCPECSNVNEVSLRPNPEGLKWNQFGYFLDLAGDVAEFDGKPFPAHFTRRCSHVELIGKNKEERCAYFWSFKKCPACESENDIAARKCIGCGELLIDPNDKLIAEFTAFKKDLSQVQTDDITFIRRKETKSKSGQNMLALSFGTEFRIVQAFFSNKVQRKFYDLFLNDANYSPKTVTYKKSSSGYMHIYDFNRESDKAKFERELRK
ncbi:MAG: DEAD/DEAH box helicase family protein [Acinetobacter sp.]